MKVVVGGIYRHFKGHIYRVIALAKHSETQEDMVVYENVNQKGDIWVRPLSLFTSLVDHEKYPEVKQTYRFECIEEFDD